MFEWKDEQKEIPDNFWDKPFNVRDNPYKNMKRIFYSVWNNETTPEQGREMIMQIIDRVTDEQPFDWGEDE